MGAQKVDGDAENALDKIIQYTEYGVINDFKKGSGCQGRHDHGGENEGQGDPSTGQVFTAQKVNPKITPRKVWVPAPRITNKKRVAQRMPDFKAVEYLKKIVQPYEFERFTGNQHIFIKA